MKLKMLITSIGLGAGLMYFLDPQHGEHRRTMVRDKANRFVNDIDDSIDMALKDARNRARGILSEMTAKLSDEGAPDWILEERVRSNLGRMASHAHAVTVTANGGRIILSGPVLREDEDAIVKAAVRTRGVH
ncbi:MAG TPA: BON domain-containing protein, partial [Anaerolineales bacterium]